MSDWLAAYEAQKAKALKKIEEGGGGAASSGNARGALGGSTSFQGMVISKVFILATDKWPYLESLYLVRQFPTGLSDYSQFLLIGTL